MKFSSSFYSKTQLWTSRVNQNGSFDWTYEFLRAFFLAHTSFILWLCSLLDAPVLFGPTPSFNLICGSPYITFVWKLLCRDSWWKFIVSFFWTKWQKVDDGCWWWKEDQSRWTRVICEEICLYNSDVKSENEIRRRRATGQVATDKLRVICRETSSHPNKTWFGSWCFSSRLRCKSWTVKVKEKRTSQCSDGTECYVFVGPRREPA